MFRCLDDHAGGVGTKFQAAVDALGNPVRLLSGPYNILCAAS